MCDYSATTLAACTAPNTQVVPNIEMFISGDTIWYSCCFREVGLIISSYCPYGPLSKEEWLTRITKALPWTIQKLLEMANGETKKGTETGGVKREPLYLQWVLARRT